MVVKSAGSIFLPLFCFGVGSCLWSYVYHSDRAEYRSWMVVPSYGQLHQLSSGANYVCSHLAGLLLNRCCSWCMDWSCMCHGGMAACGCKAWGHWS